MPRPRTKNIDLESGRAAQKQRTRDAIVAAATALVLADEAVSMASIAARAGVSMATLYRNFPDLPALQLVVAEQMWRPADEVLAGLGDVTDPVVRVRHAADYLLTTMVRYRRSVRAVVAASMADPEALAERPALRLPLIAAALEPVRLDPAVRQRLTEELAVVIGPESLLVLMDVAGLAPDAAAARLIDLAETVVRAAVTES